MVLTYAVALRCLDIHSSALLTLLWAVLTLDLVSYPNKATCFGRMHCRLDLICDWRICRLIAAPELYFSEVSRAKDDPLLTPHCFCHPDIEISCRPVTMSPPSTSPLSMTDSRPASFAHGPCQCSPNSPAPVNLDPLRISQTSHEIKTNSDYQLHPAPPKAVRQSRRNWGTM